MPEPLTLLIFIAFSKPCLHVEKGIAETEHPLCVLGSLQYIISFDFHKHSSSSIFLVLTVREHCGEYLLRRPQATWEPGQVFYPYFTRGNGGLGRLNPFPQPPSQEKLGSEPRVWIPKGCAFVTGWTASDVGALTVYGATSWPGLSRL